MKKVTAVLGIALASFGVVDAGGAGTASAASTCTVGWYGVYDGHSVCTSITGYRFNKQRVKLPCNDGSFAYGQYVIVNYTSTAYCSSGAGYPTIQFI